ncbi:MAG: UDP-N-acetylmuramate--L-alanine ligase, partial [Acidobacteriota bacterium]
LVVTSSAIRPDNPEVVEARRLGLEVIPRAEMLAELMKLKESIAVAGAHGKTTVSSMVAVLLASAGLDPTAVIGGRLDAFGSNARLGKGRLMVVEADESDGSFLHLEPTLAVITNLDREHLDHYRDMDEIEDAFLSFAGKIPAEGAVILCADDERLRRMVGRLEPMSRKIVSYGFRENATVRACKLELKGEGSTFDVVVEEEMRGPVSLRVPGRHNVLNSLAAVAVGLELRIPFDKIRRGLEAFTGVDRRLQITGVFDGVTLVDDYCHHPSEIRATIEAVLLRNPRRLWAVFEPHRYTRTAQLMDEFSRAFKGCARVDVLDIYPASETPLPGVNAERLVDQMRSNGAGSVTYAPESAELIDRIVREAQPGDLIVTMGAGNISKIASQLVKAFEFAHSAEKVSRQ